LASASHDLGFLVGTERIYVVDSNRMAVSINRDPL
jgi:hypothetical protein